MNENDFSADAMSMRDAAALAALQGLTAKYGSGIKADLAAMLAVEFADKLLVALATPAAIPFKRGKA